MFARGGVLSDARAGGWDIAGVKMEERTQRRVGREWGRHRSGLPSEMEYSIAFAHEEVVRRALSEVEVGDLRVLQGVA